MQKKYVVIMIVTILILSTVFMVKCTNDLYIKEMTYDILSYEESPDFIKDRIEESKVKTEGAVHIIGSDEPYIVIMPPEGKSVEVLYVGKDESYSYGVVYRYKYIDQVSDDILDNIKTIKINNYSGSVVGIKVND